MKNVSSAVFAIFTIKNLHKNLHKWIKKWQSHQDDGEIDNSLGAAFFCQAFDGDNDAANQTRQSYED